MHIDFVYFETKQFNYKSDLIKCFFLTTCFVLK